MLKYSATDFTNLFKKPVLTISYSDNIDLPALVGFRERSGAHIMNSASLKISPILALALIFALVPLFFLVWVRLSKSEEPKVVAYLDIGEPKEYLSKALKSAEEFDKALNQQFKQLVIAPSVRHYTIDAFDDAKATSQVREVIAQKPEVVVVMNFRLADKVHLIAPQMPLVFSTPANPFVDTFLASNQNAMWPVTGVTAWHELDAKRLEIAAELFPKARRIGIVADEWLDKTVFATSKFKSDVAALGLQTTVFRVESEKEYVLFLEQMRQLPIDLWYIPSSYAAFVHGQHLAKHFEAMAIPTMWDHHRFLEYGGSVAYQINRENVSQRLAVLTAHILNGIPTKLLPIEKTTSFSLHVNTKLKDKFDRDALRRFSLISTSALNFDQLN
jgi:ABC-type uncharacterized transport system substrate-binding protein